MRVSHRALLVVVVAMVVAALAGVVVLRPTGRVTEEATADLSGQSTELVDATLVEVTERETDPELGLLAGAVDVDVVARLDDTGETVELTMTDETPGLFEAGQRVRLAHVSGGGEEPVWFISDLRRDRPLLVLTALFVAVVVLFGRRQGLRALVGLVISGAVIIGFVVPAILDGRPPVLAAIVGAVLVLVTTLYLSHGAGPKTTAAVIGTAGALVVTAGLALVFVEVASLTGLSDEEARLAAFSVSGLSLDGLLLAGIIIGGLGVLDDVTISQASTVFELRRAMPEAPASRLARGAMTVGRDHVAATINTLVLAYAGAALPLLILFTISDQPAGIVLSSEVVAVEVVRTLVGSIGLVAAVPLTTLLAAALAASGVEGSSGRGRRRDAVDPEEEAWLQRLREVQSAD